MTAIAPIDTICSIGSTAASGRHAGRLTAKRRFFPLLRPCGKKVTSHSLADQAVSQLTQPLNVDAASSNYSREAAPGNAPPGQNAMPQSLKVCQ
jgi:hypothetical protein